MIIPAIEVLNPVKFWKSLNTKDADCLCVLQANIVTTIAMKERILKTSAPFEILSSNLEPHMFINVANKVMHHKNGVPPLDFVA